jgi:hypothetical protein
VFLRLGAQYQDLVKDLVLSLQALAESLQKEGVHASCYSCGDGSCSDGSQGASFVADLLDGHAVRFLVSDYGINWVEMRHGVELVKLEGSEAIQELDRLGKHLRAIQKQRRSEGSPQPPKNSNRQGRPPGHRDEINSPPPTA